MNVLPTFPQNPWNDRIDQGYRREVTPNRPWYQYGMEILKKHVPDPRGKRALDVGCGVGEFARFLGQMGFIVSGVDGNAGQLEKAAKTGAEVHLADLERPLALEDHLFDVVACLEVIEHIARAELLLRELHRVLKKDGFLLLTTPNFAFFHHRIHYLFGAAPWTEGVHLRHFTRKTLGELLHRAGFAIVGENSYGPVPFLSTLLFRLSHREHLLWHVKGWPGNLLAYDLVYLASKEPSLCES